MRKGWEIKKIGDLCEIGDGNHGGNYPKKSDMRDSGVPFIRSVNLVNGEVSSDDIKFISVEKHKSLNKGHLKTGDVLFTNRGDIGKCAIVGSVFDDANLNSQIAFFRCSSSLYNRYLFYFLQSPDLQSHLFISKTGAALQQFTIGQIVKLEIPIPPLPEQRRIVSVLDEAFASIAQAKSNAEQNLVNARELFEAAQRELFESVGNKKSEVKLLGDVATFRNGINFTKGSKGETVKIVGVKDFQNYFWVPLNNLDSVTIDGKLNETDYLRKGDILAVRSNGNQQLIGRSILAGDVTEKTTHSGFTIRIRFESKDIFPEYLCHYLKSEKARKQLISGGTGISIKSLNQTTLSELPISLPPLAEQRAIVGRLEALSAETKRLEEIYQSKVDALEELRRVLLGKAFEGEL